MSHPGDAGANASRYASRVEILSKVDATPFLDAWFDLTRADHFWFQWRLRATWRLLETGPIARSAPLRVLEVGCGTGVLRAQLEAETSWTVDGADLDRAALERVPEGRGKVYFYDLHDRLERFRERYDLIVLYDVLEHVSNTAPFLDALFHHLRPGGHLLVNVPALSRLYGRYDAAAGHQRRYGIRSLVSELRPFARVEIVDVRFWGLALVPVVALRNLVLSARPSRTDVIERGFKPPSEVVHRLLKLVMRLETAALERPLLGSSLLLLARKQEADQVDPADRDASMPRAETGSLGEASIRSFTT